MSWLKTVQKSFLGFITFIVATVSTDPSVITNMIPENIAGMTVGGLVAALLVGIANYLKNKSK